MGIDEVESKRKSWPGTNLVMTGEGARYSFLRTNALKPQAGSSSRDIQPVDTFDMLSVLICQHSLKGIDSSRAISFRSREAKVAIEEGLRGLAFLDCGAFQNIFIIWEINVLDSISRAEGRNKCTLWIAAVELIEGSVVFISIY